MADDQQQRRGIDSRTAARVRRARQREEWERSRGALGPMRRAMSEDGCGSGGGHLTEEFASALGAAIDAAARLPVCDRAAKLHAGLHRVAEAVDIAQAQAGARSLVEASQQALLEDPWMRFHDAAVRLAASLERSRDARSAP